MQIVVYHIIVFDSIDLLFSFSNGNPFLIIHFSTKLTVVFLYLPRKIQKDIYIYIWLILLFKIMHPTTNIASLTELFANLLEFQFILNLTEFIEILWRFFHNPIKFIMRNHQHFRKFSSLYRIFVWSLH